MSTRTIQATVQSVAVEQGQKGEYLDIKVKQPRSQWPETYKVWDMMYRSHFEALRGNVTTLTLAKGKLKPNAADDGQIKSHYWELVVPQGQPLGEATEQPPPEEQLLAGEPWADAPTPKSSGRSQPPADPTRMSIERQKAMDIASHLTALCVEAGITHDEVWEINKQFFLRIMAAFHLPEDRMLVEIKKNSTKEE